MNPTPVDASVAKEEPAVSSSPVAELSSNPTVAELTQLSAAVINGLLWGVSVLDSTKWSIPCGAKTARIASLKVVVASAQSVPELIDLVVPLCSMKEKFMLSGFKMVIETLVSTITEYLDDDTIPGPHYIKECLEVVPLLKKDTKE